MKKIACLFLLCLSVFSQAQDKYITKTGIVTFEASVPSFEEVKATNTSTTAIFNSENGEFAALVLIKGFRFKNALMEEHFNENYAESNKYPKATFKGKINNFSTEMLSSNSKESYIIKGTLEFHGTSKVLQDVKVSIQNTEGTLKMDGNFTVLASDYNIEIPKIVSKKLSNEVKASFEFELFEK